MTLCVLGGCAGESDMHRISLQVNAAYTQQKKPEFDQFANLVISAISNGDSNFLLEKFDPESLQKFEATVKSIIEGAINFQAQNSFAFSKNKDPLLSLNEREEFGFEYTYTAKAEKCSANLVISEIIPKNSAKEQIYIYNIKFDKIKGECKGLKNE